MGLPFVDKLVKDHNGVKYLLVRQEVFGRTVDAKKNENKRFPRNRSCIFDHEYKKELTKKIWVFKRTEFAGDFKKLLQT